MEIKHELKRQWQEKLSWSAALAITLGLLIYFIVFQHPSSFRIVRLSLIVLFFAWGTWLALKKPDVLIQDGSLYLYDRISPKPFIVSLTEIQAIERHREFPIWRVPRLNFYLKDGSKLTFSAGANEGRMKRIIRFIETETALKIKDI